MIDLDFEDLYAIVSREICNRENVGNKSLVVLRFRACSISFSLCIFIYVSPFLFFFFIHRGFFYLFFYFFNFHSQRTKFRNLISLPSSLSFLLKKKKKTMVNSNQQNRIQIPRGRNPLIDSIFHVSTELGKPRRDRRRGEINELSMINGENKETNYICR